MVQSKYLLEETQIQELVAFRKELHAHPEVSGEEYKTAERVLTFLKTCSPDEILTGIGGTGLIATFDSGNPGPSILFRAELDALPIQEINSFEYASQSEGVSHKCGHDGHTTVLLGLARKLQNEKPKKGKVILLFQPAEEDGQGAKSMLEDAKLSKFNPDMVFAFHNLPGYPLHQIVSRKNTFTAAVCSLIFQFAGKTAHAAEPENGLNPSLAIAAMLMECDKLSNNDPEREDFKLITPVHVQLGELAYGVSAGYGELHLTIRSWTQEHMNTLAKDIISLGEKTAAQTGIKITHKRAFEFSSNQNNDKAVDLLTDSATQLSLNLHTREYPFKWGEDFGLFTQLFPGAMFGIGSGEDCPALHNPDYDFPDEIIPTGIELFHTISQSYLK